MIDMACMQDVHQTHAGRIFVQPLVSSNDAHTSPPSSDPALSGCVEAQPKPSAAPGQHDTAESENKNKIQVSFP